MASSRLNAQVNDSIILGMEFFSAQGTHVDPYVISRVVIRNTNGDVLETITNINRVDVGKYSVETSALWNITEQVITDTWHYTPNLGELEDTTQASCTINDIVIGSPTSAYVTVAEIRGALLGFDFSAYSDDQLESLAQLSKSLIDDYLGRSFGAGQFTEHGETSVDRLSRIVIKVRNRPVASILSAKVYVPGSEVISLEVPYLDVYREKGYMYYNTQSAVGTHMLGTYPSVVLQKADKVSYEITYTTTSEVPAAIKQASLLTIGELVKAYSQLQATGVEGSESRSVRGFRSGEYEVKYSSSDDSSSSKKPANQLPTGYISPLVKGLIDRYKSIGQNVF